MNIRKWLIKKLGGYTEYEYELHVNTPIRIKSIDRKIDTIKVRRREFNDRIAHDYEFLVKCMKQEMVNRVSEKLLEEGYFQFITHATNDSTEIECRLDVVKPYEGSSYGET